MFFFNEKRLLTFRRQWRPAESMCAMAEQSKIIVFKLFRCRDAVSDKPFSASSAVLESFSEILINYLHKINVDLLPVYNP